MMSGDSSAHVVEHPAGVGSGAPTQQTGLPDDDRAEPGPESIGIPQRVEADPCLPECFGGGVFS